MERRTIKIRELEWKLQAARNFIREFTFCCIDSANKNKTLNNAFWAKRGVEKLESTKESI